MFAIAPLGLTAIALNHDAPNMDNNDFDFSAFQVAEDFALAKPLGVTAPPPPITIENPLLPPVAPPTFSLPDEAWAAIDGIIDPEGDYQLHLGEEPEGEADPLSSDEIADKWYPEVVSLMRENDCYEFFQVEIGIGKNSSKFLDYTHTGMSTAVRDALRDIKAKSQTFPMMKGLVDANKILVKIRKKAQSKMSFTGYSWLATDEQFPEVAEILEYELKGTAKNLRIALLARYDGEFRLYLAEVSKVLLAAIADIEAKGGTPFDFEKALAHYADQFPTRKDVATKLKIRIVGPKRIPKLADQAMHSAEIQEAIAQLEAASLKHEANSLEVKRLEAQKQLLLDEQVASQRAIARAMEWAENKMLEAFNDFFGRFDFDNLKPGDLSPRREESIAQALTEIESIMGKPGTGGFTHLMEHCQELAGIAQSSNKTKGDIQAKIEQMKKLLTDSVKPVTGGVGHRAFAGSMVRRNK